MTACTERKKTGFVSTLSAETNEKRVVLLPIYTLLRWRSKNFSLDSLNARRHARPWEDHKANNKANDRKAKSEMPMSVSPKQINTDSP